MLIESAGLTDSVTVNVPPAVRVITTVLPFETASKPVIALIEIARLAATVSRLVPEAVPVP